MAGVAIRLANRVSTALRPVVDLRPTVRVDHDGRLAYQSPGCVGADRGVMFDDPWNAGLGRARLARCWLVIGSDERERAVAGRLGVYGLDGESLDVVEVASGRGDDGEHS